MKVNDYLNKNIEDLSNKRILFLGGTAGIGKEAIFHLLKKNASIILLARNLKKANDLNNELKEKFNKTFLDIIEYDQSDYESIKKAVNTIKEKQIDFDICVCNAGIMLPKKELRSKQGRSLTIDTNFVGLALFLKLIVPLYKNKRYILQGSIVAGLSIPKKDILNPNRKLFRQYNISKAGVESLYYYYLNNNKDNEFLLVEPGITPTDILNGLPRFIRFLRKNLFKIIVHQPIKASLTILQGISSKSKNGDYIVPRVFTISGFPKYKRFPKRRQRNYLLLSIKELY